MLDVHHYFYLLISIILLLMDKQVLGSVDNLHDS